jgi:hypothetical protein
MRRMNRQRVSVDAGGSMQRVGLGVIVAVAMALSLCVPTSASAQSRMPSNPYGRLFRGRINPDSKTSEQPSQPLAQRAATIPSEIQIAPVCMPAIYGDASVDPFIRVAPPTNGVTPPIRVIPAPPCRKLAR